MIFLKLAKINAFKRTVERQIIDFGFKFWNAAMQLTYIIGVIEQRAFDQA